MKTTSEVVREFANLIPEGVKERFNAIMRKVKPKAIKHE
jgi:hypothetical protein